MRLIEILTSNGYILLLPILIWNILFTSKLPEAYEPKSFNSNIPIFVLIGENVFRFLIFLLPLFIKIDITSKIGKIGLNVYLIGCAIYFASWLILIYAPNSFWSISIFGFTAPAYTPLIWLLGVSLMANSYYFNVKYSYWHLLIPSILFSIFHITHSIIAYLRIS